MMTEIERIEMQQRMDEYPASLARVAHILEERPESRLIYKLEGKFFTSPAWFWFGILILVLGIFKWLDKREVIKTKCRFSKNWLFLVMLIGLFLFVYKLGTIPPGVYSDEAAVTYNAYSVMNTGKDEYGKILPVYFKLFGSYSPGLFVYLQTIPIKILGLNSISIRLWSVIFMLMFLAMIYWFLEDNKLLKSNIGFVHILFFALTPWVIFNARLGYETTVAFVLISIGLMLYKWPIAAFSLISLSTYAAHTERFLAPLVILSIYIIFYFRKLPFKKIVVPTLIAGIIQIPNIILMFTPAFWVKSGGFDINFIDRYLSYFSPANLFYRGDYDLQRSIPQLAVLYSWMVIPWLAGIYEVITNLKTPIYKFLLGLTVICPIPAALANVNFSTQRALPLLFPYLLIIGIGSDWILSKFKTKCRVVIIVVLLMYSGIRLWRSYFILFPAERARSWNGGYEQLTAFIKENPKMHFVVDNSRGTPYIELLYFLKYPPEKYLAENQKKGINYYFDTNFSGEAKINNIEVRPIYWREDICKSQILVGDDIAISEDQAQEHYLKRLWEIKDSFHKVMLTAYQTDPERKCKDLIK